MPIDAAAALAELDRLVESIGIVQNDDSVQTSNPPDFGRFLSNLDREKTNCPTDNQLIQNADLDFGQFGQKNPENGAIGVDLQDLENKTEQDNARGARARINNKSTVQPVQLSKMGQSPFPVSSLRFGQSLDSCGATVQNPLWLQSLDPDRPPDDVPASRWRQFVKDVRAFAGSQWAEQATKLGWTGADLYGCDDLAPVARVDKMGLLWLLKGNRLIALSTDAAVIETRTGARQTYRRMRGR